MEYCLHMRMFLSIHPPDEFIRYESLFTNLRTIEILCRSLTKDLTHGIHNDFPRVLKLTVLRKGDM